MGVIASQVFSAIFLLITTFLIGTLPSLIGHRSRRRDSQNGRRPSDESMRLKQSKLSGINYGKLLSFLMNFGGGVLFATCFVHMIPEIRENFEKNAAKAKAKISNLSVTTAEAADDQDGDELPITEIMVCVGFFIVYLAEEIVHLCISHSHDHSSEEKRDKTSQDMCRNYELRKKSHDCEREDIEHAVRAETGSNYGSVKCHSEGTEEEDSVSDKVTLLPSATSHIPDALLAGSDAEDKTHPVFRCVLIVFALSFHSLFEGLAIGLQDTVSEVWQLLLAISLHKLLIAFVVGLDIHSETKSLNRVIIYMIPFSLMSPLGVLVGTFSSVNVSDFVTGLLSAISAGSLLYVTFFEILLRERTSSKISGLLQFAAVFIGFITMTGLQLTAHD
ncbi:Zinc transporter ZIP1 [Halotydeus destructor]|nr:Zinc transporter ZIP1 [Halotydeus destructor]